MGRYRGTGKSLTQTRYFFTIRIPAEGISKFQAKYAEHSVFTCRFWRMTSIPEYAGHIVEYTGYHGCAGDSADVIQAEGFKKSVGREQMFGDGVYFFEEIHVARWWAVEHRKHQRPAIIKATVRVDSGAVFETFLQENIVLILEVADGIRRKAFEGKVGPKDTRYLFADAINWICSNEGYTLVRGYRQFQMIASDGNKTVCQLAVREEKFISITERCDVA